MILGYSDDLSVVSGADITVKVSAEPGPFTWQVVRLDGVEAVGPHGTHRERPVGDACFATGRHRPIAIGSYARLPWPRLDRRNKIRIRLDVMPTMVGSTEQVIAQLSTPTGPSLTVKLGIDGRICLATGTAGNASDTSTTSPAVVPQALVDGEWHHLDIEISPESAGGLTVEISQTPLAAHQPFKTRSASSVARSRVLDIDPATWTEMILSAGWENERSMAHFDGRLTAPTVTGPNGRAHAAWDFSVEMSTTAVHDRGPQALTGALVNRPIRGVLGPHWDRSTLKYTDDPRQWNAVHFHRDDLDDAGWAADFTFPAPKLSGVYAVKLMQDGQTYWVPFFVRATGQKARTLFLAPTNTYLAYGNEHLWFGERGRTHQKMMDFPIQLHRAERLLEERPELGLSLYDTHADGSGVVHASRRRPLTNWQPDHVNWLVGGRRHLSADLFIIGLLEHEGLDYDVATDEDLDRDGVDLLSAYDVVLTGSHPEYTSPAMLDAIEDYLGGGGRLMYLGGNGFFWVTDFTDTDRTCIEVRRGVAAQRNWTSHPAEMHQASTGEMGAAWRHRGRDQPPIFGVGMAAAGWGKASGYARSELSHSAAWSWVFDGVRTDPVGEHGYALGGAAGDELDHADAGRGTPASTAVLASSRHGARYHPSLDAVTEVGPGQDGADNAQVRADVVIVDHPGGGRVFSVGSICWAASLGTDDYDNDVARITANVLRRFLDD